MTTPAQTAEALREIADAIEQATDEHELLRLAALATWRLQDLTNTLPKEPKTPDTP